MMGQVFIIHDWKRFSIASILFFSLRSIFISSCDPPGRLANAGLPYPKIGADIFQFHARIFLAKIHLDAPGQSCLPCKSGFHLSANSLDGHALRQLLQGGQILVRLPAR